MGSTIGRGKSPSLPLPRGGRCVFFCEAHISDRTSLAWNRLENHILFDRGRDASCIPCPVFKGCIPHSSGATAENTPQRRKGLTGWLGTSLHLMQVQRRTLWCFQRLGRRMARRSHIRAEGPRSGRRPYLGIRCGGERSGLRAPPFPSMHEARCLFPRHLTLLRQSLMPASAPHRCIYLCGVAFSFANNDVGFEAGKEETSHASFRRNIASFLEILGV